MGIAYTDTLMGIVLHTLAALGYALLVIPPVRALSGHADTLARPWEKAALALVLLVHAAGLYELMLAHGGLRLGLGLALSSTFWLGMLFFLIESLIIRVDGVRLALLPLAALATLTPLVLPAPTLIPHAGNGWLIIHLLLSLAAYGLMTIAALHAILMAAADRRLHNPLPESGHPGMSIGWARLLDAMPPLLAMEHILFSLIQVGFVLLTLAMISGSMISLAFGGPVLPWDHKTIFTLLSWLTFGVLLIGRAAWGWRGRLALRYTLLGAAFLLLAYIGSRFVFELILHR